MNDSDDPYADAMSDEGGNESSNNQTAILPKSFCGSMEYNVGDTFPVKVERITDDAYVVSKAGKAKEDREEAVSPEDEAGAEAGGETDSEMAGYMT